jgi:hypothetical protein
MDEEKFDYRRFPTSDDDPLGAEHRAVTNWVESACRSLDDRASYCDIPLKSLPDGQVFLTAKPEQAKRYVRAAFVQLHHWDLEENRITFGEQGIKGNLHQLPEWRDVSGRRRQTLAVVTALMRRTLPFESEDLLVMLKWCNAMPLLLEHYAPLRAITRAIQGYVETTPLEFELGEALRQFSIRLRRSHENSTRRLATTIEQLLPQSMTMPVISNDGTVSPVKARTVHPAPSGHPAILSRLKRELAMLDFAAPTAVTERVGPDNFGLPADSPLRIEHALLSNMFREAIIRTEYRDEIEKTQLGQKLITMDSEARGRVLLALAERSIAGSLAETQSFDPQAWDLWRVANDAVQLILSMGCALDLTGQFDYLLFLAVGRTPLQGPEYADHVERLVIEVAQDVIDTPLKDGQRFVLHLVRASLVSGPLLGTQPPEVLRLSKLIDDGLMFYLVPGEAWTDLLNVEISRLAPSRREQWAALFRHLLTATSSRPSDKWLKTAQSLTTTIGADAVTAAFLRWFPLVSQKRAIPRLDSFIGATTAGDMINDENAVCLRGMLWIAPELGRTDELCHAVAQVALAAYRKMPGFSARSVTAGNAAVYALARIASPYAIGQLAALRLQVKFGTAQKEIEKGFNNAARTLGLPRERIEEMTVTSYDERHEH